MTIKKIVLSTIATSMIATSAFGAATFTASSVSVGAEGLASDAGYLNAVDVNTSLTVDLLGSLTDGSIIYTFADTNGNALDINATDAADVRVWLDNNNTSSAVTGACANGTTGQIICTLTNPGISSGNVLVLADDNATAGHEFDFNVTSGFAGATVTVQLAATDTSAVGDSISATLMTAATEWTAAVGTSMNGEIDASADFLSFANSATDDNGTIVITQTAPVVRAVPTPSASWVINPDRNTSAYGAVAVTGGGAVTQGRDNNYTTAMTTLTAGTFNFEFTPTVGGTVTIEEAAFTTSLSATFGTNVVSLLSASDFGSFSTYGYTGNIPGASYSSGVTDTVLTLVNNQSAATADAIVTIKDADGDSCSLTSASATEVTKPTANSSTKYRLSTMLGNSGCSALSGTSYSLQVTLPTTPTSVYVNAFVTRTDTTIPSFKVLPVYNNGTKY